MVATLPLILFPFCLIAAALTDAKRFLIPNEISAALVFGFFLAAFLVGMPLDVLGNHLLTGLVVLIVGFVLFCTITFGAGDGKLLAAVSLWFGWPSFMPALLYVSLTGGVLAVGILGMRWIARAFPGLSLKVPYLMNLAAVRKPKLPYGIAISIGSLLAFNQSPLFQSLVTMMTQP